MHIHILGIGGTFMGGLARLAKELGHEVTGSDRHVYPPMSEQLDADGIGVTEGYAPEHLDPAPDLVVIGNALSRGNPAVEYCLDRGLPYTSGPAFLADHILRGRWVLAVSGTHGKTTTSSMLAWILEAADLAPGFLIGGVPKAFGRSARIGHAPFFVVEADEYDSAFFDKRSKFVHYRPRTAVINNIELDHADIFDDLDSIKRQFHHFVRTIPATGLIVRNGDDANVTAVLEQGCWTPTEPFTTEGSVGWWAQPESDDLSRFSVHLNGSRVGVVDWSCQGRHNMLNALAAIAAARHAGVPPAIACQALGDFSGVKRRMERLATIGDMVVYDDFAHHPSAIASTLDGLRRTVGHDRPIVVVLELRSNTMRAGTHRDRLPSALAEADRVFFYDPPGWLSWDLGEIVDAVDGAATRHDDIENLVSAVLDRIEGNERIVVMSNGGFDGLRQRLVSRLQEMAGHGR